MSGGGGPGGPGENGWRDEMVQMKRRLFQVRGRPGGRIPNKIETDERTNEHASEGVAIRARFSRRGWGVADMHMRWEGVGGLRSLFDDTAYLPASHIELMKDLAYRVLFPRAHHRSLLGRTTRYT